MMLNVWLELMVVEPLFARGVPVAHVAPSPFDTGVVEVDQQRITVPVVTVEHLFEKLPTYEPVMWSQVGAAAWAT